MSLRVGGFTLLETILSITILLLLASSISRLTANPSTSDIYYFSQNYKDHKNESTFGIEYIKGENAAIKLLPNGENKKYIYGYNDLKLIEYKLK